MPFISNKRISKIEQTLETIQQNIGINNSDSSDMQLLGNNLKNQSDKVSKRGNLNKIDFQRKKAAYALNLCTVSVSQIIDYADINILDQEYDAILNNINLENMPKDEALLNIFERIFFDNIFNVFFIFKFFICKIIDEGVGKNRLLISIR